LFGIISFSLFFLLCGILFWYYNVNIFDFFIFLSFISLLDPDYLAFVESLNKAEEPPPSIETHLEEIEAKKCKYYYVHKFNNFELKQGLNTELHLKQSICVRAN